MQRVTLCLAVILNSFSQAQESAPLIVNFKDGKPDGKATHFNGKGELTHTEIYKDGVFVEEIKTGNR